MASGSRGPAVFPWLALQPHQGLRTPGWPSPRRACPARGGRSQRKGAWPSRGGAEWGTASGVEGWGRLEESGVGKGEEGACLRRDGVRRGLGCGGACPGRGGVQSPTREAEVGRRCGSGSASCLLSLRPSVLDRDRGAARSPWCESGLCDAAGPRPELPAPALLHAPGAGLRPAGSPGPQAAVWSVLTASVRLGLPLSAPSLPQLSLPPPFFCSGSQMVERPLLPVFSVAKPDIH